MSSKGRESIAHVQVVHDNTMRESCSSNLNRRPMDTTTTMTTVDLNEVSRIDMMETIRATYSTWCALSERKRIGKQQPFGKRVLS